MGQTVAAFGEHVAGIPVSMAHNVIGEYRQHVTGANGIEERYIKQFQGNMEQVAFNHVSKAEYNRQKFNEQNPGDAGQILGKV